MEEHSIYEQIAARTGGSVYIGVVGPVRTGKSTFVKRLMEQLVLPNIEDPYRLSLIHICPPFAALSSSTGVSLGQKERASADLTV